MTSRYDTKCNGIWSDLSKYQTWAQVMNAVIKSHGLSTKKCIPEILGGDLPVINAFINEYVHEMIGFISWVEDKYPECVPVYYGLAASDVMDTSMSLMCMRSGTQIMSSLVEFRNAIEKCAKDNSGAIIIGRTHGQWAEPMKFSSKLASWIWDITRHINDLNANEYYGKMSGPVGSYNVLDPDVERKACYILGLYPAAASSQIVDRSVYAKYICQLALIASTLERIATEIRNLARPEIDEVYEVSKESAAGSSSMKHKSGKNPGLCERICSLARMVRSYVVVAMENIPTWHERDLTNSANERMIYPEAYNLTLYMIESMYSVIASLGVDTGKMMQNICKASGTDDDIPAFASHIIACSHMSNGNTYSSGRNYAASTIECGWCDNAKVESMRFNRDNLDIRYDRFSLMRIKRAINPGGR